MKQDAGTIGPSVIVKGEVRANESLTIDGQVEGKVELDHHVLTIGPKGRVKGHVLAKDVIVTGRASGDIMATETITLNETASVKGDLVAPTLAVATGASLRGKVDTATPTRLNGKGKGPKKPSEQSQAPEMVVGASS